MGGYLVDQSLNLERQDSLFVGDMSVILQDQSRPHRGLRRNFVNNQQDSTVGYP